MTKRTYRAWLAVLGFALMAVFSSAANASMSGIDHLADNLSVTDFWVNGTGGFQAGQGGGSTPSPALPEKWHSGLTAHVVWDVRDWEHDKGSTHEADVPVDPYTEDGGHVWVHFLANGTVRVVVSDIGPRSPNYPGPHDPIPERNRGIGIRHGSIGATGMSSCWMTVALSRAAFGRRIQRIVGTGPKKSCWKSSGRTRAAIFRDAHR